MSGCGRHTRPNGKNVRPVSLAGFYRPGANLPLALAVESRNQREPNMTNQTPQPVSDWQNDDVKGLALCCSGVFEKTIRDAESLRRKQAEYLATLPVEPEKALKAALKRLFPIGENYPSGFEDAFSCAFALDALIEQGDSGDEGPTRDATRYVSGKMIEAMMNLKRELDALGDILGNPGRLK